MPAKRKPFTDAEYAEMRAGWPANWALTGATIFRWFAECLPRLGVRFLAVRRSCGLRNAREEPT